ELVEVVEDEELARRVGLLLLVIRLSLARVETEPRPHALRRVEKRFALELRDLPIGEDRHLIALRARAAEQDVALDGDEAPLGVLVASLRELEHSASLARRRVELVRA